MHPWLQRILHLLQLARFGTAFTAVSNLWVMAFLALGLETPEQRPPYLQAFPLPLSLFLLAVMGLGVHIYGVSLNDILDARRDRLFSPDKPIPAGRIRPSHAIALTFLSLMLAILAAVALGTPTAVICILASAGILFYNGFGKFFPATGLITLGLVRAGMMAAANPQVGFAWPIWLNLTHAVACLALVHRLEGKRPRLLAPQAWALCAGWLFWTFCLLAFMGLRHAFVPHASGVWIGPILAAAVFAALAYYRVSTLTHRAGSRRRTLENLDQLSLLWLILYDAAWLLGAGLYLPGYLHISLFLAACLTLWFLRWLLAMLQPLPSYQTHPSL